MRKLLFTLSYLLLSLLLLSSCDDGEHTHSYASEWSTDAAGHWKVCQVDGCDSTAAVSAHSFETSADGTSEICNVCKHERRIHIHTFSEKFVSDGSYHWRVCTLDGCGEKTERVEHTYGEAVLVGSEYYLSSCSACGYERTEAHSHTYSEDASFDRDGHYYRCIDNDCEAVSGRAPHSFGTPSYDQGYELSVCTVCGADNREEHGHRFLPTPDFDELKHWYECTLYGCGAVSDEAEHSFGEPLLDTSGKDAYACSGCEYVKYETHTHIPSEKWFTTDGEHYKECTVSGCEHTDCRAAHDWKMLGIITEPTPDKDGEEKFECTECKLTKLASVKYVEPPMSEEDWLAHFVFENVVINNIYSFGGEETVDVWYVDGERILIVSGEVSEYATADHLESFAFLAGHYDDFDYLGDGAYLAEEVSYYDAETEDTVTFTDVKISFIGEHIASVEMKMDLGFAILSDSYVFVSWGNAVVPEDTREHITAPEAIDSIFGMSLDNYTMTEEVSYDDGSGILSTYLFDEPYFEYSVSMDGELIDEGREVMSGAGADYALDTIGFFYALSRDNFLLNSMTSDGNASVYDYQSVVVVDGTEYRAVSVAVIYDGESVSGFEFSFSTSVMGSEIEFSYVLCEFGTTVIEENEAVSDSMLYGMDISRVAVSIDSRVGGVSSFMHYMFDYSDYLYSKDAEAEEYGYLKNASSVYTAEWLGDVLLLGAEDFTEVTDTKTEKVYSSETPVTAGGVEYSSVTVRLSYMGSDREGYTLYSITAVLSNGSDRISYTYSDFGAVCVEHIPSEAPEIPSGYTETLLKGVSLENYKLTERVLIPFGDEVLDVTTVYEFDSHRARCYLEGMPETADYLSENYVGMAYATQLFGGLSKIARSKYTLVDEKISGEEYFYVYGIIEPQVIDGVTYESVTVGVDVDGADIVRVTVDFTVSADETWETVYLTFSDFGDVRVALPDDETVVKLGYERINSENYAYETYLYKGESVAISAYGRYDSGDCYEKLSSDDYGRHYYTACAGLHDIYYHVGFVFDLIPFDELEYSVIENDAKYDIITVYRHSKMVSARVFICGEFRKITLSALELSFSYNSGAIEAVTLEYEALIDGEIYTVITYLSGFGAQSVTLPSDRAHDFDPQLTDELCGKSLENFHMHESVTKSGAAVSNYIGQFEKDFASYKEITPTSTVSSFKGAGDKLGVSAVAERLGFLYELDPWEFTYIGGTEDAYLYSYGGTVTVDGDRVSSITVLLSYPDWASELDSVTVKYTRTADGVKYSYEVYLSSFGKIALEREEPEVVTLSEDVYNKLFTFDGMIYATLAHIRKDEYSYAYIDTEDSYSYNDILERFEFTHNDLVNFSNYHTASFTTVEEAEEKYYSMFGFALDLFRNVSPSKLKYDEQTESYVCNSKITSGEERINRVRVRISEDGYSINISGSKGAETFEMRLYLSFAEN